MSSIGLTTLGMFEQTRYQGGGSSVPFPYVDEFRPTIDVSFVDVKSEVECNIEVKKIRQIEVKEQQAIQVYSIKKIDLQRKIDVKSVRIYDEDQSRRN
jgi:hypothetical protein